MSEYTAIALIGITAVAVQAYYGWRFIGVQSEKSGFNQAIGLFLLLMGFVSVIALFNIGIQIAENVVGVPATVLSGLSIQYYAFIVTGLVFLLWVLLVVLFAPISAVLKNKRLRYE